MRSSTVRMISQCRCAMVHILSRDFVKCRDITELGFLGSLMGYEIMPVLSAVGKRWQVQGWVKFSCHPHSTVKLNFPSDVSAM